MNIYRITILCCCLVQSFLFGQKSQNINNFSNVLNEIGQEKMLVHYNTSLFLVGEYLYYSVYNINASTNELSTLSKVGYVELIGEDGLRVFKHKISLKNGLGQGDFFIPVSVPSGNYKLVGYTKWMTNWGEDSFFQSDVSIINPYTDNQNKFLLDAETDTLNNDLILKNNNYTNTSYANIDNKLKLHTGKEQFSKREKVTLNLETSELNFLKGNYSISIRKSDSTLVSNNKNQNYSNKKNKTPLKNTTDLPEMRGGLISGKIISKNEIVSNQKILFSVPGKEYDLKVLTTDSIGEFKFSLDKDYIGDKAVFQVLGPDSANYQIVLENDVSINVEKFKFGSFYLKPNMKKQIEERSIHNQIENAYFKFKPDTIRLPKKRLPFYGNTEIVYNLDDYTRFKTVKETFVEIISNVWFAKDKQGKTTVSIRSLRPIENESAYKPLLVIDGLVVQDINYLLELDSRKIETIKIIRDKYVLGSQVFQGIIDIQTFESDFYDSLQLENFKEISLFKPLLEKKYFLQSYLGNKINVQGENIPDYRHQLLWVPNFRFITNKEIITFYTSDVTGDFEISIKGFTKGGIPVSIEKNILVK